MTASPRSVLLVGVLFAGCAGVGDLAELPLCRTSEPTGRTASVDSLYAGLPAVAVPDSLSRADLAGWYASSDGYGGYRLHLRDTERSTRESWTHQSTWPFSLLSRSDPVLWETSGNRLTLYSGCLSYLCDEGERPCRMAKQFDVIEVEGRLWLVREDKRSFVRSILEGGFFDHTIVAVDVYTATPPHGR